MRSSLLCHPSSICLFRRLTELGSSALLRLSSHQFARPGSIRGYLYWRDHLSLLEPPCNQGGLQLLDFSLCAAPPRSIIAEQPVRSPNTGSRPAVGLVPGGPRAARQDLQTQDDRFVLVFRLLTREIHDELTNASSIVCIRSSGWSNPGTSNRLAKGCPSSRCWRSGLRSPRSCLVC